MVEFCPNMNPANSVRRATRSGFAVFIAAIFAAVTAIGARAAALPVASYSVQTVLGAGVVGEPFSLAAPGAYTYTDCVPNSFAGMPSCDVFTTSISYSDGSLSVSETGSQNGVSGNGPAYGSTSVKFYFEVFGPNGQQVPLIFDTSASGTAFAGNVDEEIAGPAGEYDACQVAGSDWCYPFNSATSFAVDTTFYVDPNTLYSVTAFLDGNTNFLQYPVSFGNELSASILPDPSFSDNSQYSLGFSAAEAPEPSTVYVTLGIAACLALVRARRSRFERNTR